MSQRGRSSARAFAPATVANVGVGFDILGFALEKIGEEALVEKIDHGVVINPIEDFPDIPLDPTKNTATAGLVRLIQDKKLSFGFRVTLKKSIPVGSGLGGSSTSAVATLIAANSLLPKRLSANELLDYSLIGEEAASGSKHGDNIAPCLMGGLVFVRSHPSWKAVSIQTPPELRAVIILPQLRINTREARAMLSPHVALSAMVEQSANLTGFLLGLQKRDFQLIRESLHDVVIEPQRSKLITGFSDLQRAAMQAGALGFSISGSGPAMFALAENPRIAKKVEKSLRQVAHDHLLPIRSSWITCLSKKGAHLMGRQK